MSERGRGHSSHPAAAEVAGDAIPPAVGSGERVASSHDLSAELPPESVNRRHSQRFAVTWSVDCETEDTFLYASITNISEMGIFVRTTEPLPVGTQLRLRFAPPSSGEAFVLGGVVQWVNVVRPLHDNPNPGMGIRFLNLTLDDRERIVETIRTIAYLREEQRN